jgi:hypothetical protein
MLQNVYHNVYYLNYQQTSTAATVCNLNNTYYNIYTVIHLLKILISLTLCFNCIITHI